MALARVPLFQQPMNFATVERDATKGATIGVNLFNADGSLFDLSQLSQSNATSTVVNGVNYVNDKDATNARAITAGDDKKIIEFTYAGAITVTMSGLIPFTQGFDFIVFCSDPLGQVTFVGADGMNIESSDSLKTRTQFSPVGLMVDDPLEATLYGDLEPVALALSILGRSSNVDGAPTWIVAATDGYIPMRVGNTIVFAPVPPPTPLDTTLTYNMDGTLNVVTTASGTKTMGYSGGKLVSITGTGIYPSKNFSYTGDSLTGIDVL